VLKGIITSGPAASAVTPVVLEKMHNYKLGLNRRLSVEALAACGMDDPKAQDGVISMLSDEKPLVRLEAVKKLRQIKIADARARKI